MRGAVTPPPVVHVTFVHSGDPVTESPSIQNGLSAGSPVAASKPPSNRSLRYLSEVVEQAEVFPAASVAVARYVVVLATATVTGSPGEANAAAVPVAAGVPVQSAVE